MKKILCVLTLLAVILLPALALEVDQKEVSDAALNATIEFVNYTGPQDRIDTAEEIRGIGTALGQAIRTAPTAGSRSRYYIIHAVDPAVQTGFDADILVLGPDAGVDHIDNLRRIISAYLTAAYGYAERDSRTLAEFITIYNAVYRGKLDMFKSRYKPVVTGYLEAAKAGLALRYNEWPGQTQIVIPLSDIRLSGTISAISTTAITDPAVVEQLREDPSRGVDTRKDMVDLKEREAEAAQQRAAEAQRDAVTAQETAAAQRAETAAAQRDAAAAATAAQKAEQAAAANPDDKAAQEAAAAARREADAKAAEAAKSEQELTAAQNEVDQNRETAAEEQTFADTKQKEVIADRREVAVDQQEVIAEETAAAEQAAQNALASAIPAWALRIVDEQALLSELLLINLADGKPMKTSTLNTIRGRFLYDTGSALVAIAGKKAGNGAIRLVQINPQTLEILKQGTDNIAEYSVLVQSGADFYAVIEQAAGGFVLGRFDSALEAKAKSALTVSQFTPVTVTAKGLLVQAADGQIRLLRATDLSDQTAK